MKLIYFIVQSYYIPLDLELVYSGRNYITLIGDDKEVVSEAEYIKIRDIENCEPEIRFIGPAR